MLSNIKSFAALRVETKAQVPCCLAGCPNLLSEPRDPGSPAAYSQLYYREETLPSSSDCVLGCRLQHAMGKVVCLDPVSQVHAVADRSCCNTGHHHHSLVLKSKSSCC